MNDHLPPDEDRDRPTGASGRRIPLGARILLGMIVGVALIALIAAIYALIQRPSPTAALSKADLPQTTSGVGSV